MRWIFLVAIFLTIHSAYSEEDEEYNYVSPLPKINLDSNLRRALLKALTELENEEKEKEKAQYSIVSNSEEKIIEKASAASVSVYANSESVTASPIPPSSTINIDPTTSETYNVILQKSEAIQQKPVANLEKAEDESILTSASNNFADQSFGKDAQSEKSESISQNSIFNSEKSTTKLFKPQTTTIPPKVSTEESEAKAEDVQFFSAPLVAAFTVHQDELGLPKRVEPIFRIGKTAEEIRIENEQIKLAKKFEEEKIAAEQIRLEELRKTREKLQIQQKQKALEDEIVRLNLNLKQQQEYLLRQQEDFRLRNNAQSFAPNNNSPFSTPSPLNLVQQPPSSASHVFKSNLNLVQQLPVQSNVQQFKAQAVTIQPSLSFNSLPDGGKLPLNAQFLPVKGPVDFRAPFSSNNINQPHFPQQNNFNQQAPNNVNQQNQNSNRFFRQNSGFGNFGGNDFSTNTNSFSIQPAIQQTFNNGQSNRFFRSNTESTLTAPQFLQPPHIPTHQQSNRFFRSNLENPFNSNQANNNYQLSNLLYTSGALRGKSPEDLSIISKVLSLNHVGGRTPGISLRPELQGSFGRNF
ncbi:myb-like protein H isoform X2 [Diabrotica virgifera virgifera]|uniref:Myb-like protein H isoform X2 n=1 Tax=Diabrotica virgifera virgifera TaxID=50390 RepID=A0A6P7FVK8_DIAVI|nr:myb-like protein H isoform X2 [Diabrotica virgifera virgifera]